MADFDAVLRRACAAPTGCRPPPSPRSGTSSTSTEPLVEEGRDIVSIHISGGISGTVEAARQADRAARRETGRKRDGDRLGDAPAAAWADGVWRPPRPRCRAAMPPRSVERTHDRASRPQDVVRGRHARVPAARWADRRRLGLARHARCKIKPILTFEQEITPIERVRTSARALRRLTEYAEQRARRRRRRLGRAAHPGARRRPRSWSSATEKIMGKPPLFVSEVGPVIGTHAGPGLLGVGGVPLRQHGVDGRGAEPPASLDWSRPERTGSQLHRAAPLAPGGTPTSP